MRVTENSTEHKMRVSFLSTALFKIFSVGRLRRILMPVHDSQDYWVFDFVIAWYSKKY
jgi:hypothetical protein